MKQQSELMTVCLASTSKSHYRATMMKYMESKCNRSDERSWNVYAQSFSFIFHTTFSNKDSARKQERLILSFNLKEIE